MKCGTTFGEDPWVSAPGKSVRGDACHTLLMLPDHSGLGWGGFRLINHDLDRKHFNSNTFNHSCLNTIIRLRIQVSVSVCHSRQPKLLC